PYRAAFLSFRQIPEALALPLEETGITASDIILLPFARLFRLCEAADALGSYREYFRHKSDFPGPDIQPPGQKFTDRYPDHLTAAAPRVAMFAAAIRHLRRRGVPAIVLIQPVHVDGLKKEGLYDRLAIDHGLEALRKTAIDNDARVIDLSFSLTEDGFID